MNDRDEDQDRRERMTAFGYDADNPETMARFKDLEDRERRGVISQKDVFRDMEKLAHEQADRERVGAHAERDGGREAHAGDAQAQRDEARERLNAHIDRASTAPNDREDKSRALNDHLERSAGTPGDRDNAREAFRETAHEVTGTRTPDRGQDRDF